MAGISNLSSRFRGSLIGALIGDCLGGPFEGDALVSKTHLIRYFNQLLDPKLQGNPTYKLKAFALGAL